MGEDVEDRLTQAVGRRPDGVGARPRKRAASEAPADDSHARLVTNACLPSPAWERGAAAPVHRAHVASWTPAARRALSRAPPRSALRPAPWPAPEPSWALAVAAGARALAAVAPAPGPAGLARGTVFPAGRALASRPGTRLAERRVGSAGGAGALRSLKTLAAARAIVAGGRSTRCGAPRRLAGWTAVGLRRRDKAFDHDLAALAPLDCSDALARTLRERRA